MSTEPSAWLLYGNRGAKRTPGDRSFRPRHLDHEQDLRDMRGRRPTAGCEAAADAVLAGE